LPGGQKQAVAIARATIHGLRCLILDEPTAALAVRQTRQVLDRVRRAQDTGQAVISIMHNLQQAMSVTDEVVVLARGRVMGQFSSANGNPWPELPNLSRRDDQGGRSLTLLHRVRVG
jgi:ABC-type sugar transport system ATPase subunit